MKCLTSAQIEYFKKIPKMSKIEKEIEKRKKRNILIAFTYRTTVYKIILI